MSVRLKTVSNLPASKSLLGNLLKLIRGVGVARGGECIEVRDQTRKPDDLASITFTALFEQWD